VCSTELAKTLSLAGELALKLKHADLGRKE
jgi:hypothetical protein